MDSGLVTSEQAPHRRGTVAMLNTAVPIGPIAGPTVTCRQCRGQIPLDDMESHECNPKDVKAATSSPRAAALLEAAAKASSFLDTFLDTTVESKASSSQKSGDVSAVVVVEPKEQRSAPRSVEIVDAIHPAGHSSQFETVDVMSPSHRYESLSHSRSLLSQTSTPDLRTSPQHSLASLGRSMSVSSSPPPTPSFAVNPASPTSQSARPRGYSTSETGSIPFQSRVRGVRLNKDKVAVYSIVSSILNQFSDPQAPTAPTAFTTSREVIVERRYREFYAFALTVYSMFPSQELWQRLPPKTLCLPTARNQSGGFLLRRKNGLDDFVRRALELIDLGSTSHGSISQWYLVRKFLNLPPTITGSNQPAKDRNLVAAMNELTKHARQAAGWTTVRQVDEHDATFEKVSDGFHMVKRVKTCPFPARAIFDRITERVGSVGENTISVDGEVHGSEEGMALTKEPSSTERLVVFHDPLVESVELLRRENRQTWTERVVFKGNWTRKNLEMVSLKSWKVDDSGSIVIVMIPAEEESTSASGVSLGAEPKTLSRVDCILGGWIISPVPGEETCAVTWLMQANFGECDPRSEFTGSQGFSTAYVARSCLLSWAEEITHLLASLETTYDPAYYRNLGPLLSGGDFNKLKLERRDTVSRSAMQDPRVYILAHELEPSMCLLIHKSTNTNALIFRANYHRTVEKDQQFALDTNSPLKAEWIMFEKPGNPRQDLSVIERSTTYPFSTRNIGQNIFHFTLELLRRDCVLRYDQVNGYALFTTINGKPNMLLKRVYLVYSSKTQSRLSFSAKLEEIQLFGKNEMEVIGA